MTVVNLVQAAAPPPLLDSADFWNGWGSVVVALGIVLSVAILLGIVSWQFFTVWRARTNARVSLAEHDAYRQLAEDATAAQMLFAEQQHRIVEDLAELRDRVASIEQMLREVD